MSAHAVLFDDLSIRAMFALDRWHDFVALDDGKPSSSSRAASSRLKSAGFKFSEPNSFANSATALSPQISR
jgi:hypothetical protein